MALTFGALAAATWVGKPRAGAGHSVVVEWSEADGRRAGVEALATAGVVDHPTLFRVLLAVTGLLVEPVSGPHLLRDDLTPAEVVRRLSRLSSRARTRVTVPEGFNRFKIGARLEEQGVCPALGFARAATDTTLLSRLLVRGDSAEGYLFPATYDLFEDSAPEGVVAELVTETGKRLAALRTAHVPDFARLEQKYGWGDRELLTLASIIEKETGRADEQPLIASVFYNRLDDPDFRPAKSLQSDPTAAYGCLVVTALESCQGYAGKVTPAMLRDAQNPYNTYRHPGLPPGPISNPGLRAIESALAPATSDFLFFVRAGEGRHTFTRSFEEHEAAMGRK